MSSASQNQPNESAVDEALKTQILSVLDGQIDPYLAKSLSSVACISHLSITSKTLNISLVLPYPCQTEHHKITHKLTDALTQIDGIDAVNCDIHFEVTKSANMSLAAIPNVNQIVAVASGKGGVGKSTTAVNLALAMAQEGARVGILDADIYGPSIPLMLGLTDFRPVTHDGKTMSAAEIFGIQAQSIGFMLDDGQAAVWRGPMAASALVQLLTETDWPELDYLFIDMPPGTGDIQLTLSQKVPVNGAVIVTTPQDIALADAKKGINMFQKVNTPVLGIVENMSYHICSECGHKAHPFGQLGGSQIAERYHIPLLGSLPLELSLRESMDSGAPLVISDPESQVAQDYRTIAKKLAAQLALQQESKLSISIEDEE